MRQRFDICRSVLKDKAKRRLNIVPKISLLYTEQSPITVLRHATFPTRSRLNANDTPFRRLAPYKIGLSFLQSPGFGSLLFKGGGIRRVTEDCFCCYYGLKPNIFLQNSASFLQKFQPQLISNQKIKFPDKLELPNNYLKNLKLINLIFWVTKI